LNQSTQPSVAASKCSTNRHGAHRHVPLRRTVIKLMADDYGVPCRQPEAVWRPVLAASEAAFREIAHHPS
jgi:hypothetical protein